jgi:hypothetical protein
MLEPVVSINVDIKSNKQRCWHEGRHLLSQVNIDIGAVADRLLKPSNQKRKHGGSQIVKAM